LTEPLAACAHQIYAWRKQLLENAARAFQPSLGLDTEKTEQKAMDDLYAKIGQRGAGLFSQEVRKMSAPDRREPLDRAAADRENKPANDTDPALMRRIDELDLRHPFLGSRRIAVMLSEHGDRVNRKRVQRLMRPRSGRSRTPRNRRRGTRSILICCAT
jgi:HTH-like domain